MENNEQLATEADLLSRYFRNQPGISREEALRKYWGYVRGTRLQIFELLRERGEMYVAEVGRALEKSDNAYIREQLHALLTAGIVEEERRSNRMYYQLRPGIAALHQQYLDSQNPDQAQL